LVKVLELFEREKRPLSSSDIGAGIGAPRSSTAALLRSMVDMAILGLDRATSSYLPTPRFGRLAAWMNDKAMVEPVVLDAVKRILATTFETVTLTVPVGLWADIILVERGTLPISFGVDPGQKVKLWGSAVGTAYLTTIPQPSIAALYERGQQAPEPMRPQEHLASVLRRVAQARRKGYATAQGGFVSEASAISVPLPSELTMRRTILTVAGPNQRMRAKHDLIAKTLLSEVEGLSSQRQLVM
jgi:DNA-binding IclR family transcriptional regulator